MSMLEHVRKGRELVAPRLLIYGAEGVGKSSVGSQAPKAIFLPTEDGLAQIDCARFPLTQRLEDVITALTEIRDESHDYETLVIDSLSPLERLIFDALCRQHNVASIERVDGGYGKGYTHALSHWRTILGLLDEIRDQRDMAILLIAHAKVERFEDPESSAYDRYAPRLHKHASALVTEWCDVVAFATQRFRTQTEDAGFGRTRSIAAPIGTAGGDRVLRCIGGPTCVAKNRYGLPEEVPLTWAGLLGAMSRKDD